MAALFAILAAVGWGSSDYAAGSASRRASAVSVVVLTHFVSVLVLVAMAVDLGPLWSSLVELAAPDRAGAVRVAAPRLLGTPSSADIAWGVTAGLGGGFGAMLLFRGLGRGSMAIVAPITAAGAAAVPVLVGVASGESLRPTGVAGIVLAMVAIVLVSWVAADASPPDEPLGGDPTDGPPLTVPDAWVDEFGSRPAGGSGAVVTAVAPAARAVRTDIASPAAARPRVEPTAHRSAVAVATLCAALVVATLLLTAGSMGALVEVDAVMTGRLALLVSAVGALAWLGPRLLPAPHPARTTAPRSATPRPTAGWRRQLRQPGLPEALLSGLGFGMFYVCISRAGAEAGHWPMASARTVSVVLFAVVALATATPVIPPRGVRGRVAVAGALDGAAALLFVLATTTGLLSIGAVLASLYPAVTVVLARWHGHEHMSRRQIGGLCLALAAVALLAA